MAGQERTRLTDAAIARLRPRGREYAVWDSRVPGLGVRVRPTGGKSYVLLHDTGSGSRRVSLGPVSTRGVDEVRRECYARRASPEPDRASKSSQCVPLFRDFVEGEWKQAHFERYKPSTRRSARYVLDRRILREFGSRPLNRITQAEVSRWFEAFSRTAPGNANNALKLLRQIMNFAIARGYIDTNPSRGLRRNRRPPLTRFLSLEEIRRLHRALDDHARKGHRQQADIIRLLLLTGCRRSEILRLRWSEVHADMLVLADAKSGPRKVPLNTQARHILESQPQNQSAFVFPSPRDPFRPRSPSLKLWYVVRRDAEIEDVRLHDLRHTLASHAVMNGVPVPVVSRLLGHSDASMTLRYAHLGDREIEQAAERIGQSLSTLMGVEETPPD